MVEEKNLNSIKNIEFIKEKVREITISNFKLLLERIDKNYYIHKIKPLAYISHIQKYKIFFGII